ncbi:MAG: diaminopimelate epimerase, partial [Pseudohongiellaceae bacterium]
MHLAALDTAMLLRFTKMHGLGNDFVVLDLITQRYRLRQKDILHIADRHFGIGCDQVLVVEHPQNPEVDFRYRIFNCDGNEVEQCGNGARCFARFVLDKKLTGKQKIKVETNSGIIELGITNDQQVRVNMGKPEFEPQLIPFDAQAKANSYDINVDGQTISLGSASMGNPHCTLIVDSVDEAPVETLGALLEAHPRFPQKVNVGFMEIIDRRNVKLRVFERGVGETLACGTGACAAMVIGQAQGLLDQHVNIELPGGPLLVEWRGEGHP